MAGLVVAANLRPAVASVGSELDPLRNGLSLSPAGAAVLTAVPVFCFGALAPAGPWLSRRVGLRAAVAMLVALLVAGLVLRIGPDVATLFAGTVVAASGIAAANVLLPVVIKRDFAARTGLMMGPPISARVTCITPATQEAKAHLFRSCGLGEVLVDLLRWPSSTISRGE